MATPKEAWKPLEEALEEARILCHKIGDKKSKFHDIGKKNLTIYADTKKEQVNKE